MVIPTLCYLLLLPIFPGNTLAGIESPPVVFEDNERDALIGLKKTFDNPILNKYWNGLHCPINNSSGWIGIQCDNGRVTGIFLDGFELSGRIETDALFNFPQLTLLSFKNNSISGTIMDFSKNRKLTHIDLSDNRFNGPIPTLLLGLDQLQSLELQNNDLTGEIPGFNQETLTNFNLSSNNVSGEIPKTQFLQSLDCSCFLGNPNLCGPPLPKVCTDFPIVQGNQIKKSKFLSGSTMVCLFVMVDALAVVLVALLFFLWCKKLKSQKQGVVGNGKKEQINEEQRNMEEEKGGFSLSSEIRDGFDLTGLLKASVDDLGGCYKAMLEDGPVVLVKRIKGLNSFKDEFRMHVRAIADLKHPNLVPLLGYCHYKDEKLLVYKLGQNVSLFDRIHGGRQRNREPFEWNSRLSVAQDVARAMSFLHLNSMPHSHIPHGNLTSLNVHISNDKALVSDYGLAPLIIAPIAFQSMMCYKSPEYHHRQKISPKSDVWSYGCLLLELLMGGVSSHLAPKGGKGVDVCNWVHKVIREEWAVEIFDREILRQRSVTPGMLKLLHIATRCCNESPEKRPEMLEVLKEVEEINVMDSEDDEENYPSKRSFSNNSISISRSVVSVSNQGRRIHKLV